MILESCIATELQQNNLEKSFFVCCATSLASGSWRRCAAPPPSCTAAVPGMLGRSRTAGRRLESIVRSFTSRQLCAAKALLTLPQLTKVTNAHGHAWPSTVGKPPERPAESYHALPSIVASSLIARWLSSQGQPEADEGEASTSILGRTTFRLVYA